MPVARKYFYDLKDLREGDLVRFEKGATPGTMNKGATGTGHIELIWYGCEEMCRVRMDAGEQVSLSRSCGDVIERP